MADTHPADLSVADASEQLATGQLTSVELVGACLDRIEARDRRFGAWLNVYADDALAGARNSDSRRAHGAARGPLDGIPLGLKDVIGVAGYPVTADSAVLQGNVARTDAGAWHRLHAAGMILLGHLHCGEFACGTWGRNPWSEHFSAGGSSSGSGVALATRTVPAALGTDTRGSIRNPSAQNAVTGVKPTIGLVSTKGIIPLAFSYDVVGPMARSAADCAILMTALSERPGLPWPTSLIRPCPLAGARIGMPRSFGHILSGGVANVYERFCDELAELGAVLVPIDRPPNPLEDNDGLAGGYKTIIGAEARAVHTQFTDRRHLLREEFRRDFPALLDHDATAAQYVLAQRKRVALVEVWRTIFADHGLDAVVEPCSTGEIWKRHESVRDKSRPPRLYSMWSDTNFPVVVVPAGRSKADGGPVGMQIIGLPHSEPSLLNIAMDYQAETAYHLAMPPGLDEGGDYVGPSRPSAGPQPAFVPPQSPFDILHIP
jgi:aspartyl-tRNA(Asn)/glutamyl-tRNA(Gln) amidotransferase subunit A